ncbi:YtxH domain-containing protein [Streptomyces sp. NPDC005271]|uniref:YtxH domain-containing protein n=1 Tax=unclassified Streptomyces TaxID=2593676 RepID=UPI0033BEBB55
MGDLRRGRVGERHDSGSEVQDNEKGRSMRYRLTFMTGMAVGYVLGARAGRERYEQLRKWSQRLAQNPAVRNAAESAAHGGRQAAVKAVEKARPLKERFGQREEHGVEEDDWGTSNT